MITLLALALSAPQSELAPHHPPTSALYLECPDVPAVLEAYTRAPAIAMLGDEAVGEAWAKLTRTLGFDAQGALQPLVEQFASSLSLDPAALEPEQWLTLARRAKSISFSVALRESEAGEARAAFDAMGANLAALDALAQRIEKHAREHSTPPESLQALALPDAEIQDRWGRPFAYEVQSDGAFRLSTLGRDGAPGGVGVDAELFHDSDLAALLEAEFLRRIGVCAVARSLSAKDAGETAEQLLATAPPSAEHAKLASGWSRWRWSLGEQRTSAWLAHKDEWLVLGAGSSELEELIARSQDPSRGLSTGSVWAALESAGGAARGVSIARGKFDARALIGLELLAETSGRTPLGSVLSLVGDAHGAWRTQLDGARFVTDVTWNSSDSLLGLLGAQPAPREAFADIPADAVGFFAANVDAQAARARLASLLSSSSESSGVDALSELERQFEFDLDTQIVENLRGGVSAYLLPYTGLGLPQIGLIASIAEPASFEKGLRGLFKALEATQSERLSVRESKYRDAPLWTVSFTSAGANPQLAAFLPTPSVTIVGNRLVFSVSSLRSKKEIKRLQGEPEGPHPVAADASRFPADAGFAGWMNWPATIDGVWSVARSALAMFGGQLSLPVDLPTLMTALPESASVFTRFFEPTMLTCRASNGVYALRWETSFGPESLLTELALVAGGVSMGTRSSTSLPPANAEPEDDSLVEAQHVKAFEALRSLSARIAVFRIDQARLPASLAELSQPTTNYPRGFLEGLDVERDPWGAPFHYQLSADGGSFRLWSAGPDGVDADGQGDDLLAP